MDEHTIFAIMFVFVIPLLGFWFFWFVIGSFWSGVVVAGMLFHLFVIQNKNH